MPALCRLAQPRRYNRAMRDIPNIFLVGMPGAGKTTVGRQLARRLGRTFIDSDHEIEARTGVAIPTIFEIEGEAGFRKRESAVLQDIAGQADLVVATGGGIVLDPANRACMAARGYVVYLAVPPEILQQRTAHDRSRPLLQGNDLPARIAALFQQRDPLYRDVADLIVPCGRGTPTGVARRIEDSVRQACEHST